MSQALLLPQNDELRLVLHNEVHARPSARIALPALVTYVAVLNEGISRAQEHAHLSALPGQQHLALDELSGNFLRLRFDGFSLKWERHSEFTRYSIVQPLPAGTLPSAATLDALQPEVSAEWLSRIPGRTVAAMKVLMLERTMDSPAHAYREGSAWFDDDAVFASTMGGWHSLVLADFQLRGTGFEHVVVIAEPGMPPSRAGRVCQRLLELETYRLMALRGLPVAKALTPMLSRAETQLAEITEGLERRNVSESALLDALIATAAQVEHATAEHQYRFSATEAYHAIVERRIAELHEGKLPGVQTLGEFMQRRLSPAIATVSAAAGRLSGLSERIGRISALLRTRVDIATEAQNQQLLSQLGEGQQTQLRMQATVEGLSLAAITYYVVSLVAYGLKALKTEGWLPISPELATGLAVPLVLAGVWWTTRRIHRRFFGH
ncbi:MAG: DUF3422 domain-containing protein [Roseateles depolymerans]|uniref:DUF3422 domain-containing protein n=1 Tax=Roseateles depolymerans TaxID=76731 RepID=A0A2W5DRZ1_9BURK|nr:MAG: DUF3422 domain-containing protein [Roseateles depolymerans]